MWDGLINGSPLFQGYSYNCLAGPRSLHLTIMSPRSCVRGDPRSVGVGLTALLKLDWFIGNSFSARGPLKDRRYLLLATSIQPIHMGCVNLLRHRENGSCYHFCYCCVHSILVSHSTAFQFFVTLRSRGAASSHLSPGDG